MKNIDLELIAIAKNVDKYRDNLPLDQVTEISRTMTHIINSLFRESTSELEEYIGEVSMEILLLADMLMLEPYAGLLSTDTFSFDLSVYSEHSEVQILTEVLTHLRNMCTLLIESPNDVSGQEKALWSMVLLLDLFTASIGLSMSGCKHLIRDTLS
tara:strand:+ start:294 stop:761 length:468 start_codon:yes stop_codon:yes gene_type:complete